jgi:uroporphyrinogen decarboxylase
MEAAALKKKYGDKIAFWGGVDSQQVMPTGSISDVEAEVRSLLRSMAENGGLVVCSVHNIQADVPTDNVLALYDSVRKWGTYPLHEDL